MSKAPSVAAMFLDRVRTTPDGEAFRYPAGQGWNSLTWKDTGERVRAIACGLRALGLKDEERVAILSGTRVEWILADLGILCAGGATTTIYPSSLPEDCAYIIGDSNSVFVFAETQDHVKKLASKRVAAVMKVIVFEGDGDGDWVMSLADLEKLGREAHDKDKPAYDKIVAGIKSDALATLIYTSGTTGKPKGVELTHGNWVYEGEALVETGILKQSDLQYLWLPLAHSFGKVLESAQIAVGFPTAIDGRIDKIVENLGIVKPTFVGAVPRIFEKVHNKIVSTANESGGMKLKIFRWAFSVGRNVSARRRNKQWVPPWLAVQNALADKLVFSKVRARFGGRLRFFISGSAPLALDIAEFFHAAGLLILEGYGLTESSAGSFVNRPDNFKFGTVGLPFAGTEVKIAPEDGEILIRGRGIMRGYHGLPDATAEALDKDGWLHTGDIGVVHPDGLLQITDRKKDLIKTSGGKYIAPQALEGKFKALCPFVSQVVVHGNNRNFCSALLTLDEDNIKKWAVEHNVGEKPVAEYAKHPEVQKLMQGFVDQLNSGLASYETIKRFAILPADLTQEAGDLTPSLKVKRKTVEEKHKKILDAFYVERG
jgi:long-chain acyl-CoA synthetase